MVYTPKRLLKVVVGLFIFAVGIVLTINASLGVSPWDVLNQGFARTVGITIGQASIVVGFLIIFIDIFLGQPIGWSTVMNMILIGTFMDILMLNNIIPIAQSQISGVIMILGGLAMEGLGSAVYISQGIGAGPRDGLMVIVTKRSAKPVGFVKFSLEVSAVVVGAILGGHFGLGTVIMAFSGGPIFQKVYKMLNFDVSQVSHRSIQGDFKLSLIHI